MRGDAVGTFLRIYHAVLEKCLQQRRRQRQLSLRPAAAAAAAVKHDDDREPYYLLLGPVARLLGLFCATRVSVKHLRAMLVLAEDPWPAAPSGGGDAAVGDRDDEDPDGGPGPPLRTLARLHILRALRDAAERSLPPAGVLDRPGPATFFSFGGRGGGTTAGEGRREAGRRRRLGGGLSCTLNTPWPFKYDFGMACWFRAESFAPNGDEGRGGAAIDPVVLFSATARNGALIAVSFEAHAPTSAESTGAGLPDAATLVVTVRDAAAGSGPPVKPAPPRRIRLGGCVLASRAWCKFSGTKTNKQN